MRRTLLIALTMTLFTSACSGTEAEEKAEPVEFIDVRVQEISDTEAVVRFETSRETTCELQYGTLPQLLDSTAVGEMEEPFMVDHEVWLTDLAPDTTYYFKAEAADPDGKRYLSDIFEFDTKASSTPTVGGGGGLVNVASSENGGAISDVSSNFGGAPNDARFGADLAIDGEVGTEWSSNGDGDDAFVEVELAVATPIERVGFRSRKMADGTSIIESFRLVVDGTEERGPFQTPNPDQTYYFELTERVTGTNFRFEAVETTGGNTGAREVMLFAAPE